MRKDQAIKIQYASKYAGVANYWKKWMGETKGLKKANAVAAKQKFEKQFQEKVIQAGKQAEYGNLLSDFEKNYSEIKDLIAFFNNSIFLFSQKTSGITNQ